MESKLYTTFGGISYAIQEIDSNPFTFLQCDNVVVNQRLGSGIKRGGTSHYAVTGDIWGIGAYAKETTSTKLPVYDVPIRHRRDGSTSYIETLDWSADTWGALTQGSVLTGNLGIGDICSFAQPSDLLCVCAGMPAKLTSSTGNVNKLGGAAPSSAPTLGSSGTGITGTYAYCYTFYDSTTGWESSPSAIASVTVSNKQVDISALSTTTTREGVDKKNIYRSIATGEGATVPASDGVTGGTAYFYIGQVALATTTYTDTAADSTLDLTNLSPLDGDHDPPPNPSYIVASHEGRLWIAYGKQLWFSHPYDGSNYNLEYFSYDRVFNFSSPITGLCSTNNAGLQVFLSPGFGIYTIEGRTESEFSSRISYPGLGTNYHASVCAHDENIAFWGPLGPTMITPNVGSEVHELGLPIENLIRTALLEEYNTSAFAWTVWSTNMKQFIFGWSATDSTGTAWVEADTSLVVPWMVTDTGAAVDWIENP